MRKKWTNMLVFLCVLLGICCIFGFSAAVKTGSKTGLLLCGSVIIPALFPFTLLATFLNKANLTVHFNRFFAPINGVLFRTTAFDHLLLGFCAGYPIGCLLIGEEHKKRPMTERQILGRVACGVNAGPAFLISAIGQGFYDSTHIGVVLFLSLTVAGLLNGFLWSRKAPIYQVEYTAEAPRYSVCFVEAVEATTSATVGICGYVLCFSIVLAILQQLCHPAVFHWIAPILEVTTGLAGENTFPVPVLGALLGFGGLSVQFQGLSCLHRGGIRLPYWKFLLPRLTHGGIAFILLKIYFCLFPSPLQTVLDTTSQVQSNSPGVLCLLSLLLLGVATLCTLSSQGAESKINVS